jgi:hypothetical protein
LNFMIIMYFLGSALCFATEVNTQEFIKTATVSYKTQFSVDTNLEIWNKLLDNLIIFGKLWELYGCQPSYKITRRGSHIHITDDTGIKGDLVTTASSQNRRIFYARGNIDHWAIPSFIVANVVFIFDYQYSQNRIDGKLAIHIKGDNSITDLLVWMVSDRLLARIESRFTKNMADIKRIIFDVMNAPDKPRRMLTGEMLTEFNRLFGKQPDK